MSSRTLAPNIDLVQRQLLQYAQDLQQLMRQQSALQQHHQKVLQFIGHCDVNDDLLLNTILKAFDRYLVTSALGEILHASPSAERALAQNGQSLSWLPIEQLMRAECRANIQSLLNTFVGDNGSGAIYQTRLHPQGQAASVAPVAFDALVLRSADADQIEIYWLLSPPVLATASTPELLRLLALSNSGQVALLLTNENAEIIASNVAYSQITGYKPDEVLGQNPNKISSGLQDTVFYQNFWSALHTEGSWSGEFFNRRKNGQLFLNWSNVKVVKDAQGKTCAYFATFSDMSSNGNLQKQLELEVHHDPLTGLPNRRLFEERLSQTMKANSPANNGLYVLSISLERFRDIANELGHDVGDRLMELYSARLKAWLPTGDVAARLSGNEFVVMLSNVTDNACARTLVNTLLSALSESIHAVQHDLVVTTRIGYAHWNLKVDVRGLIDHARSAMQMARRQGISCAMHEA